MPHFPGESGRLHCEHASPRPLLPGPRAPRASVVPRPPRRSPSAVPPGRRPHAAACCGGRRRTARGCRVSSSARRSTAAQVAQVVSGEQGVYRVSGLAGRPLPLHGCARRLPRRGAGRRARRRARCALDITLQVAVGRRNRDRRRERRPRVARGAADSRERGARRRRGARRPGRRLEGAARRDRQRRRRPRLPGRERDGADRRRAPLRRLSEQHGSGRVPRRLRRGRSDRDRQGAVRPQEPGRAGRRGQHRHQAAADRRPRHGAVRGRARSATPTRPPRLPTATAARPSSAATRRAGAIPTSTATGGRCSPRRTTRRTASDLRAFDVDTAWMRADLSARRPATACTSAATLQRAGAVLYPYLQMDAAYDNADRWNVGLRLRRAVGAGQVRARHGLRHPRGALDDRRVPTDVDRHVALVQHGDDGEDRDAGRKGRGGVLRRNDGRRVLPARMGRRDRAGHDEVPAAVLDPGRRGDVGRRLRRVLARTRRLRDARSRRPRGRHAQRAPTRRRPTRRCTRRTTASRRTSPRTSTRRARSGWPTSRPRG